MPARPRRADGDLRAILDLGAIGGQDDAALLDLFERHPGAAADRAFEALVARHGPLVLRVARLRLESEEDARDAFQATFWLLARRSRSIRNRAALAGWLFGVASRVAARARVDAARRRARERRAALPVLDSTDDPARRDPDLAPGLLAEIHRLPAPYRLAVVLADLEGLSSDEAAARLACPVGTFKARLSRARSRLRARLAARGLAPLGWRPAPPSPLVVPLPLIQAARRLALSAPPAGPSAVGSAVILVQGASRTMFLTSIPAWAAAATLTLAVTVGTAVVIQSSALGPGQAPLPSGDPGPAIAAPSPNPSQTPRPIDPLPPSYRQALDRAVAAAEATPDRPTRVENLLRVGQVQTQQGDHAGARATFRKALAVIDAGKPDENWTIPHPIGRIAEAQARNGDRDEALRTVDRAVAILSGLRINRRFDDYRNTITNLQRTLGRDACRGLIAAFRADLDRADVKQHFTWLALAERAKLIAQDGDFAGAFDLIRDSPEYHPPDQPNVTPAASVFVAGALTRDDPPAVIEAALAEARGAVIVEAEPLGRFEHLRDLMTIEIKLGRFDAAVEVAGHFDDVLPPFVDDSRSFNKSMLFGQLARAENDSGQHERARTSARRALDLIRPEQDYSRFAMPVSQVVWQLVRAGADDEALAIFQAPLYHSVPIPRDPVLQSLKEQGKSEAARRWAEVILGHLREQLRMAQAAEPAIPQQVATIQSQIDYIERIDQVRDDLPALRRRVEAMTAAERDAALPGLARALAREGQVVEALTLVKLTDDPALRREIEMAVAFGLPALPQPPAAQPRSDAAR